MQRTRVRRFRLLAALVASFVFLAACGSEADNAVAADDVIPDDAAEAEVEDPAEMTTTTASADGATTTSAAVADVASGDCAETAALFVTRGSANPDLEDPEVTATCDGDSVVVVSNAVPDYTYIGTSPGVPGGRDVTVSFPAEPAMADEVTAIPYIGTAGVSLGGIPIFGPTEGTGGDVDSLPGILSVCGSHNGPSGFHIHKIGTSDETDCLFTPDEVAAAPQLVGYALDGFPIYTGADQYTSSWQLTDESLFASDTWAAHTYVEGSGDLDQCNGLTDTDGNYAYYTTETFPYVVGCFAGEVELTDPGGDGGDRPEPPADGGDRPEPPADDDRPEPPADDA